MPELDDSLIDSWAPNSKAISNGRALALKKKVTAVHCDADNEVYFGLVQGSGKNPYRPSADFVDPAKPVFRCSCPSRQIPCKHVLGLLYAITGGIQPSVADVPDDLAEKRDKALARAEKKKVKAATAKPKKVNKAALAKKLDTQLAGLDLLEQLTLDLARQGLGTITDRSIQLINDQIKQLGDHYLPGAQQALRELLSYIYDHEDREIRGTENQDERLSAAVDQLARLQSLVQRGREYLQARKDDPELKPDTSSSIAAQLGHAWQLTELAANNCISNDAELIQLAFNTYDDASRGEYVDEGLWCDLQSGDIHATHNYRPYKATNYIKEEDSCFHAMKVPELAIYPGEMNKRVRWDRAEPRTIEKTDRNTIRQHGHKDILTLVKSVRAQLKSPLADKQPAALLHFKNIGIIEETIVLEDAQGDRIEICDCGKQDRPTTSLLKHLDNKLRIDHVALLRFDHHLDSRRLRAQLLTIVSPEAIVRLGY